MKRFCGVHQHQLVLLLAAAVATALDTSHNLASERSSIESTYELTKYLEYQLKQIKDVYLTYLGPPFNEKDFSPPRPNSTALSLPSAATRLELWHGLENQARLAQNQRAYSVLLAAVRELARSTLCPSLKTSLLHFCTGLDGLLGSISALMTTLGYALPPQSANMGSNGGDLQYPQRAGGDRPAPLMSQSLYRSRAGTRTESGHRNNQKRSGMRVVRGEREDGVNVEVMERRRGKEGRRAEVIAAGGRSGGSKETGRGERGRRGKREEPESGKWFTNEEEGARAEEEEEEELEQDGGTERWGRRRLLSISDGGETEWQQPEPGVKVSYPGTESSKYLRQITIQNNNNNNNNNNNQYSYNLNSHPDTFRKEDGFIVETNAGLTIDGEKQTDMEAAPSSSTFYHHQRRPPRSLYLPTLQPSLSTLSFLYQFGAGEKHTLLPQPVPLSLRRGTALLSPPLTPLLSTSTSSSTSSSSSSSASSSLLSVRPTMNDFARKVEGFWILRELQSWLWRSAKDFNRLKKRLRG